MSAQLAPTNFCSVTIGKYFCANGLCEINSLETLVGFSYDEDLLQIKSQKDFHNSDHLFADGDVCDALDTQF